MRHSWDAIIKLILGALQPQDLVQVAFDKGFNAQNSIKVLSMKRREIACR